MTEPPRTANTMQICLAIFWKVEVDNDIHSLDIDTTREKVRANEITRDTVTEVVKNAITMRLKHFSVRIETRIAELGDFFGQKFDSIGRIAKNYGLIDLKLDKNCVCID